MKAVLFLTLFVLTIFVNGQDSIKFGGLDVDSIIVYPNTVWVKNVTPTDTFTTVTIGTQIWTKYNLHIDDGGGGIYSYANNTANSDIYGFLYTWAAAMRLDTAIVGYHLPTKTEVETLISYMSSNNIRCGTSNLYNAKAVSSKYNWTTSTANCAPGNIPDNNDATGLGLQPGGYKESSFSEITRAGIFWTATYISGTNYSAYYVNYGVRIFNFALSPPTKSQSVRLIKD